MEELEDTANQNGASQVDKEVEAANGFVFWGPAVKVHLIDVNAAGTLCGRPVIGPAPRRPTHDVSRICKKCAAKNPDALSYIRGTTKKPLSDAGVGLCDKYQISMAKHTELPWKAENSRVTAADRVGKTSSYPKFIVAQCATYCGQGPESTELGEHEANAEFIVHACNSHAKLVWALEHVVTEWGSEESCQRAEAILQQLKEKPNE